MDHTTLPKFEEYLQIYTLLHLAFIFLTGGTERQAGRGEGTKWGGGKRSRTRPDAVPLVLETSGTLKWENNPWALCHSLVLWSTGQLWRGAESWGRQRAGDTESKPWARNSKGKKTKFGHLYLQTSEILRVCWRMSETLHSISWERETDKGLKQRGCMEFSILHATGEPSEWGSRCTDKRHHNVHSWIPIPSLKIEDFPKISG